MVRKPPPPGTPITLAIIEDKRSLGQETLSLVRGRIAGEPAGVPEAASQWWFMLGWVMRSMAYGLTKDSAEMVFDEFVEFTMATGESRPNGDA
jgi:hypothetical protein